MPRHHSAHHHPRQKQRKQFLDYAVLSLMSSAPMFELPQLVEIYRHKNSQSVSLATWLLFLIASTAWLIYGIRNKLRPIIIIHLAYIAIETTVVVGILLYS